MNDNGQDGQNLIIEGKNAVYEAIAAKTPIDKILIRKGDSAAFARVIGAAKAAGLVITEAPPQKLDQLSETGRHQGVLALCPPYAYAETDDILAAANSKNEKPFIVILDGITDPHNLGAIIRSAECLGAHGVIIPKRRACGVTAATAKAAAGACAHVPIAKVTNITETIKDLQLHGVWVTCASADADGCISVMAKEAANALSGAVALVIGSEGEGVSRLVRETCDFAVYIPMRGKIDSLNASCAAAVLMYETARLRASDGE